MANEQYVGFLPYGSSDPSVIFADPLTTKAGLQAAAIAAGGTAAEIIAASDHDPVKGFKPQGDGGNLSAGYLITGLNNQTKLKQGGQITFEIEAKLFTLKDPTVSSTGADTTSLTQPPYCLSFKSAASKYGGITASKGTTLKYSAISVDTNITASNHKIFVGRIEGMSAPGYHNSQSYGEWITVNYHWYRDGVETVFILAFDGVIFVKRRTTHASTEADTLFLNIYLGCLLGLNSYCNSVAYMRNLQISTRVPAFGRMENVGKTVFWSDSLFTPSNVRSLWDSNTAFGSSHVVSKFNLDFTNGESGVMAGDCWIDAYGGKSILGSQPQSANVAQVLSRRPDVVVFLSGTNDAVDADIPTWKTAYQALLTSLFQGGVRTVVLCTIPSVRYLSASNTAAWVAQIAAFNTAIKTIPSWIATNHPSKKVVIADLFEAFGGETGSANNWVGGFNGLRDNLHWHSTGHNTAGIEIAKALKQISGD